MGKSTGNGAGKGIAFYIETLALLAVFAAVIVVLVNGFFTAGRMSREAALLSKAVHLAENAAEMASASDSGETLLRMLDENGNARLLDEAGGASHSTYRARYDEDMVPSADGIFSVDVSWTPEGDSLAKSTINVYWNGGAKPVYSLELAVYTGAQKD